MKGGYFLFILSSKRMWLGSTALTGLLLASSLPVFASTPSQTVVTHTNAKPLIVASTVVPTENYTQTVREQIKWIAPPVPTIVEPVVVVEPPKQTQKSTPKKVQVVQEDSEPQQTVSRSDSSSLIENAQSLVGVPYLFGGSSRSGFDCSGYTQYVFKGAGISLPRTAAGQFGVGTSVSRNALQPGDLVFFTTYASGASHVGIYIGGGSFLHASSTGVRATSLNDSYYASRYLGARRVN